MKYSGGGAGDPTHIYFRNGSKFEEGQFLSGEVPECHGNLTPEEEKKFVKTIEGTESPKAWLKSGVLVIAVDESWIPKMEAGTVVPKLRRSPSTRTTKHSCKA